MALIKPRINLLKAQRRSALVQMKGAQLDLERTEIRAPFDGRMAEKQAETGQYVNAGTRLAHLYNVGIMEVEVRIPSRDIVWLHLNSGGSVNPKSNSPTRARITFDAAGKKIHIFHATPVANNLYWYEERSEKFCRRMTEKAGADVLIFGHTHKPFRRELENTVFINAGSVGKPKDGNPQTGFVVIDVDETEIKSRFIRLDYDVEKVASAIIKAGLPPLFAEKLRVGSG